MFNDSERAAMQAAWKQDENGGEVSALVLTYYRDRFLSEGEGGEGEAGRAIGLIIGRHVIPIRLVRHGGDREGTKKNIETCTHELAKYFEAEENRLSLGSGTKS